MSSIFSVSGGTCRYFIPDIFTRGKERPLPVRNEKQDSMTSLVCERLRMKTMHVTTRNSHQVIWVNGLGSYRVTETAVPWVWAPSWLSFSTRVYCTWLWVKSWNKRTSRHVSACLWNTHWRNLQNTQYVFHVCRPVNGMSSTEFWSRKPLPYNLYIPDNFPLIWIQNLPRSLKCRILNALLFIVHPLCFKP